MKTSVNRMNRKKTILPHLFYNRYSTNLNLYHFNYKTTSNSKIKVEKVNIFLLPQIECAKKL